MKPKLAHGQLQESKETRTSVKSQKSINLQRKLKPQVTAPDDKQGSIPEEQATNPDVQSVDLGYDALEDETSDDSPVENNAKQGPTNAETKLDVDVFSTNSKLLMVESLFACTSRG